MTCSGVCIGGPWAGRLVSAATDRLRVPAGEQGFIAAAGDPPPPGPVATFTYAHRRWRQGPYVWVPPDWSEQDALAELLRVYASRPPYLDLLPSAIADIDALLPDAPPICSREAWAAGTAAPRTCAICGLGPCRKDPAKREKAPQP